MIQLTFPDNSSRAFRRRHYRPGDRRRHFQIACQEGRRHDARRQAHRPLRHDRARRQDRDRHARRSAGARAHPARCRPRHGRGGAGALSGHAGDHRPGDRERLLLRLLPERALHHRRPAGDRGEDARDRRRRTCPSPRRSGRATRPSRCSATRARCSRSSWSTRFPRASRPQDLPAGRLVRPLPRAAHGLDRPDRQRLQADEGGRRLLARRFEQPDADAHLRHGLAQRGRAQGLPPHARGGREARPPPPRPRDGPLPFPGGGAGRRLLARQGLDDLPGAHRLYAPAAEGRLPGGQRAAAPRQGAVGDVRATGAGSARTCSWRARPATRPTTTASSRSSR